MNTPKVNQSTNEIEVILAPGHSLVSANNAQFVFNHALIALAGQDASGTSNYISIIIHFFSPSAPTDVKKGDVLLVRSPGKVQSRIDYAFEGEDPFASATEGHITVEDIDLSVPLFNGRFEFHGPYRGGVGHFHGRFSLRG